jgi:cobalt-zinc-cadmium efflux system membrane fusion protein
LLVACNNSEITKETEDLILDGETIIVKENSPIMEQIVVQKAELQDFEAEFRTVGTVRPVAGSLAEIAPPFAGRIVKSYVKLGQKVSAGATIFELGATEFYEAVKSYFAAQSSNEVAQKNYNRQKELAAHGVASQKDLEQGTM